MVTVGNQGQDDRYIRLWRCNMSHPSVSRSCDCHVFDQAFLSWQITEKSEIDWIHLRTANNPSGKRRHCIFIFRIIYNFFQTNFDPSLCNNGRGIFPPGRMLHIHNIHLSSHTTTRTLRMINHRIWNEVSAYAHDDTSICSC